MTKHKRPANKFERNERKRQERETQLAKEDQSGRLRRKLYKEAIKAQETEHELHEFKA